MYFPVKNTYRFIQIIVVVCAIIIEMEKYVGIQSCDEIQYFRFNMVHFRPVGKFDRVIFHRSLFEFRECFLNIGAVINFRFVFANLDAVALYEQAIFYGGQIGF